LRQGRERRRIMIMRIPSVITEMTGKYIKEGHKRNSQDMRTMYNIEKGLYQ
jgi:hypothetical protein